jgi:predicted permease
MATFLQDLTYAGRQLKKNPGFALVAIFTLALGIGANTAVFSVIDAVLLKPLPYADPDRLMTVESMDMRVPVPNSMSYPDFFDFRKQNQTFEHLITSRDTNVVLTGAGAPTQLDAEMVTWDLFPTLGIAPALGRGFLQSEEALGTHVVVLSHKFWQSQFGGDRSILGRTITLDRKLYTVVGIAPGGFAFPVNEPNIQLWTTIADDREAPPGDQPMTEQRGAHMLTALGRLNPGVTIEQARADLDVIAAALAKQYPDSNTNFRQASVRPALETLVGGSRTPLLILLGAVGLVLLIACANIANLLLARTAAREHEMAVRASLGASRRRVLRQLLTESLLLAILGGAAGTALGWYALHFLLPLGGQSIPRLAQASIDGWVLTFSLILALLTSVIFGTAPALQASKIDLTSSLKEQTRGSTNRHDRVRGALVIAQVTLGLVLVSGAGLLMASFLRLETSDLGLKPDHLLTYWFSLPESQYTPQRQVAFYDQLLDRMRAIPGVQSAAGVWPLPLGSDNITVSFNIEERPSGPSNRPHARMALATPGYFSTAGIPLLKGRFFTERDDKTSPRVLIVNKAFAAKFFPGEDVIGKHITPGATDSGEKETPREIVGIVGSAKLFATDDEPKPIYYFPYKQLSWQPPLMVLRTAVPPRTVESAVREQMANLDPLVPIFQVRTMDELLST